MSRKTIAYNHIKSQLLSGQWEAGTFLSPAKLAKSIGMSYTPVREAIFQLTSEGLVEHVPNMGVCAKRLDRAEMEDLFNLRQILESGAAKLAATMIDDVQLSNLRQICQGYRDAIADVREFGRKNPEILSRRHLVDNEAFARLPKLNVAFHLGVINGSQNARLIKIVTNIHILSRLLRGRVIPPGENLFKRLVKDHHFHCRILRALEHHDEQAASIWMDKHIADAKTYHLTVFDWQQRQGKIRNIQQDEWSEETVQDLLHMEDGLRIHVDKEAKQ